jgi:hypothetical protein
MSFVTIAGGASAFSSASGGKVSKVSTLGTSPITVAVANPSRKKIVFHNPGTIDVYVAPTIDANGAALTIALATLGGSFLIYANGGTLSIEGECQGAWQALSASGSNNPLTVMDSNV